MSEHAEPTWILEDVERTSRESPDSFFIPSERERASLDVGRLVRLHFVLRQPAEDEPRAERMWVEVTDRFTGGYRGILTNEPAFIEGLAAGDELLFEPRHVAQLVVARDDPRWNPNSEKKALVSEAVFSSLARFVYRQDPDREEDSGWRVLAGTETDEEMANPDLIKLCNVGWLCNWDPSLEPVLKRTENAAYERKGRGEPWELMEDWEAPD